MSDDYQKHTVTTDALDTLGSIIGPDEKRDAIHLAVEPAYAGETLMPGQHVVFDEDHRAIAVSTGRGIGIVDPFLNEEVLFGERFWLVVYPRQISSLRHVWEHPLFPPSGETEATQAVPEPGLRQEAEKALREWCQMGSYDTPSFDALVRAARDWDGDDYLLVYGEDASGHIPKWVWTSLQIYFGRSVMTEGPTYFSCTC